MRYEIADENGYSVSLESNLGGVLLSVGDSAFFDFTVDEFKEFRRAVGYVWQEVEDK